MHFKHTKKLLAIALAISCFPKGINPLNGHAAQEIALPTIVENGIGTNGSLTGYAGGTALKQHLHTFSALDL